MADARPLLEEKIAVAAIDFGTTCTGYAYYLREDAKQALNKIIAEQAWSSSPKMGLQAPTTVMIDKEGQFHSFGFEAESHYESLTVTNEHKGWRYFRYFKMKLHHERDLSIDMEMVDYEGKPFKALKVFEEAIRYVKDHLMKKLKNALDYDVEEKEVSWVITVPAIWTESAKQFMREAAKAAGIPNEDLKLALEPESAAILCKELAVKKAQGGFLCCFNPGQKYLVADLGGGTVDTTIHEILKNGRLKELHAATGGDWGGQVVNQAFEDLLKHTIVTPRVFDEFCEAYMNDWITLQKCFESRKREFASHIKNSDIGIPKGLEDIYNDVTGKELKKESFREGILVLGIGNTILRLSPKEMKDLFAKATDKITGHIEKLLKCESLSDVSSILLVGGFSESEIVLKTLTDNFKKLKVITPPSASSAILRGAVMYGIDEDVIASRISPYTYGLHTRRTYDKNKHPKSRMIQLEGRQVVDNAFSKQIVKGETVYVGTDIKGSLFTIIDRENQKIYWNVYQSEKVDPVFCDDEGCKKIGRLSITIPEEIKDTEIKMKIYMTCQGTELEAKVSIVDHGVMVKGVFDFLRNAFLFGGDVVAEEN